MPTHIRKKQKKQTTTSHGIIVGYIQHLCKTNGKPHLIVNLSCLWPFQLSRERRFQFLLLYSDKTLCERNETKKKRKTLNPRTFPHSFLPMADHHLPPEILVEIFSRLPVQSLLRFRSTSKSLRSLIDSHNFINLHLKNALNFNLILLHNTNIYQLDFPNLTDSKSMIPLNHPFSTNITPVRRNSAMTLIGSCNGLLAISHGQITFTDPYGANEITFWNPTTRKHRIIPFLSLPIPNIMKSNDDIGLCVHGFGYDPLTADYKLLRISWISYLNYSFEPNGRLFSSKTNSWKVIPSMPPYALYYVHTMGVFVENSIHWIMTPKIDGSDPCLIVAFNLSLEIFNEVPLPNEIDQEVNCNESFEIDVADLGGCLCLTVKYETTGIDVWVMKKYGCRDSWCKLFTLFQSRFTFCLKSLRPLGYSSDESKVLLEGTVVLLEEHYDQLFWYDLRSEQVSYVEGIPNFDGAMICVESLVPPSFPVDNCRKKENRTSKNRYV